MLAPAAPLAGVARTLAATARALVATGTLDVAPLRRRRSAAVDGRASTGAAARPPGSAPRSCSCPRRRSPSPRARIDPTARIAHAAEAATAARAASRSSAVVFFGLLVGDGVVATRRARLDAGARLRHAACVVRPRPRRHRARHAAAARRGARRARRRQRRRRRRRRSQRGARARPGARRARRLRRHAAPGRARARRLVRPASLRSPRRRRRRARARAARRRHRRRRRAARCTPAPPPSRAASCCRASTASCCRPARACSSTRRCSSSRRRRSCALWRTRRAEAQLRPRRQRRRAPRRRGASPTGTAIPPGARAAPCRSCRSRSKPIALAWSRAGGEPAPRASAVAGAAHRRGHRVQTVGIAISPATYLGVVTEVRHGDRRAVVVRRRAVRDVTSSRSSRRIVGHAWLLSHLRARRSPLRRSIRRTCCCSRRRRGSSTIWPRLVLDWFAVDWPPRAAVGWLAAARRRRGRRRLDAAPPSRATVGRWPTGRSSAAATSARASRARCSPRAATACASARATATRLEPLGALGAEVHSLDAAKSRAFGPALYGLSVADRRLLDPAARRTMPSGEPLRRAADAAAAVGASRFIYLSSTAVYGETPDGETVDEETSVALSDAEAMTAHRRGERGRDGAPGRAVDGGAAPGRHLRPRPRRARAAQGRQLQAHRRRRALLLARARRRHRRHHLRAAAERAPAGAVYCVADDRPTTQREYADWLVARLGVAPPPSVPSLAPGAAAPRRAQPQGLQRAPQARARLSLPLSVLRRGRGGDRSRERGGARPPAPRVRDAAADADPRASRRAPPIRCASSPIASPRRSRSSTTATRTTARATLERARELIAGNRRGDRTKN